MKKPDKPKHNNRKEASFFKMVVFIYIFPSKTYNFKGIEKY